MNDLYRQGMSLSPFAKYIAAAVGVLLLHTTFRVLEKKLPRRFGKADARYKVRKLIVFSGYFSTLLFLAFLFEDRLGRLSFAFGIAGAGVAIALQDVLASIAGAFSIGFSKLYAVGDRVQIGETRGDVIDIGLLRTTLLETGNWVTGDLYNGRIVRIPNSTVLKGTVFNYSQGFRFIWDEIKVLFTITSDCEFAREMLSRAAQETIGEYLLEAQASWKEISDNYRSLSPPLEPTVALTLNAGSLEFTVSYVVDYTERTAIKNRLFTKVVEQVSKSNGRLECAAPPVTATTQPAAPAAIEVHPLPPARRTGASSTNPT
jgi:small-conductance mechanosensitive channel